ncbi:DUF2075 domain-containing protein [Alistipes provencensis]|uniref:DUF2075 domain-containing protein n=1 Tax=Alistipes provencensis TaxID=1816676 RepID=UPI00138FA192|nr:DUF2075 domain-containing protein [Alistipes provencensis]
MEIKKLPFGIKWPVVYIIHDNESAYVGESVNIAIRINDHLKSAQKKSLNNIYIIHNKSFNKSAILDIERFLIEHIWAEGKYMMLNANHGYLAHNYYRCEQYRKEFKHIWQLLKEQGLAQNDTKEIQNSDRFKYSPYKTPTTEQYEIIRQILRDLKTDMTIGLTSQSTVVNGGSGTGKSVLGIFLLKLLADAKSDQIIRLQSEESEPSEGDLNYLADQLPRKLKIGYVVPTQNFRSTLKKVFRTITPKATDDSRDSAPKILSPHDVAKSDTDYDLLIVDEAHRLRRRYALPGGYTYKQFDDNNKRLGLSQHGTELDWIVKKSKYQLFFYDAGQSIKPTDVSKERFNHLLQDQSTRQYQLTSQLRCKGGNDYIQYLEDIFNDADPQTLSFKGYSLRLYEDVNDMVKAIIRLDKKYGLCRNIAGYAWDWKTKKKPKGKRAKKTAKELIKKGLYDIEIPGQEHTYKYVWNMQDTDWINAFDSVNQIGCIHTIQGYDLNYAGVILGPDIDLSDKTGKIIIHPENYKDTKGKEGITDDELFILIKNIYKTNLARGINGTFIYVYNKKLRDHFKKYMNFIPHN